MAGLEDDFDFDEKGGGLTFDFQGYLFKVLLHWKYIVLDI